MPEITNDLNIHGDAVVANTKPGVAVTGLSNSVSDTTLENVESVKISFRRIIADTGHPGGNHYRIFDGKNRRFVRAAQSWAEVESGFNPNQIRTVRIYLARA